MTSPKRVAAILFSFIFIANFACAGTNDDILAAQEFSLKQTGLEISTNSALSVAGAMKAVELGYEVGDTIICMITGE